MRWWFHANALLTGLLMPVGLAFAQSQPAQNKPAQASAVTSDSLPTRAAYPLESLKIEFSKAEVPHRLAVERIIAVSGLKIGQLSRKEDFDAARARLLATGAFETVGYTFKPSASRTSYDATLEVMEVARMFHYRFEDLPAPDAVLREALKKQEALFGDEIPASLEVIGQYEKVLSQFLGGKTPVHGTLNYTLPGEPTILFRPPGDAPRISEVHFTGNEVLTLEQLNSKFTQVAFGTEFTQTQVRLLLDSSIRPMYEAKGRLRVAFSKIVAVPSPRQDVIGVSVTVTVEEGAEFKLGAVRIAGVASGQVKETEDLAAFKKNEVVNFDEIEKGLDRIRVRNRSNGYLHIATKVDRKIDDKAQTVDLTVTVIPGAQFLFGKLDIQGLDILSEPAIRKMWGDRNGKPFDPDFPFTFLNDIRAQGLFDNLGDTKPQTKINEDAKTADVTLIFTGSKPTTPGSGRTDRESERKSKRKLQTAY